MINQSGAKKYPTMLIGIIDLFRPIEIATSPTTEIASTAR